MSNRSTPFAVVVATLLVCTRCCQSPADVLLLRAGVRLELRLTPVTFAAAQLASSGAPNFGLIKLHRPSNKGTKLLLKVIKAIIINKATQTDSRVLQGQLYIHVPW